MKKKIAARNLIKQEHQNCQKLNEFQYYQICFMTQKITSQITTSDLSENDNNLMFEKIDPIYLFSNFCMPIRTAFYIYILQSTLFELPVSVTLKQLKSSQKLVKKTTVQKSCLHFVYVSQQLLSCHYQNNHAQ